MQHFNQIVPRVCTSVLFIKYALRITSFQSGHVTYTSFSHGFTIDFLEPRIFGECFCLFGSSKVVEYARPSCVSMAFTVSELCLKL